MQRTPLTAINALLATLAALGCADAPAPAPTSTPPAVEAGAQALYYNANPAAQTLAADPGGLYPAVGRLLTSGGRCTATLIAPDVAITAEHCVQFRQANQLTVQFAWGPQAAGPDRAVYGVTSIIRHPDRLATQDAGAIADCDGDQCERRNAADVALLVLDGQPAVAPMPILLSRPADDGFFEDATYVQVNGGVNGIGDDRRRGGAEGQETCVRPSDCSAWNGSNTGHYCANDTDNDGRADAWLLSSLSRVNSGRGECRYRNDTLPMCVRDTADYDGDGNTGEVVCPRLYARNAQFRSTSGRFWADAPGANINGGDSGGPLLMVVDGTEMLAGVCKSGPPSTYAPVFNPTTAAWIADSVPALRRADLVSLHADGTLRHQEATADSFPGYAAGDLVLPVSGNRNQSMSQAFAVTTNHGGRVDVWAIRRDGAFYHWFTRPGIGWHHETIGYGFGPATRPVVQRFGDGFAIAATSSAGDIRLRVCDRTAVREGELVSGACGGTSGWYSSYHTSKPSTRALNNLALLTDHRATLDVLSNAPLGLFHRRFTVAGGRISAAGAEQRIDVGAPNDIDAGIAAAGGPSHRMDVYYARNDNAALMMATCMADGPCWTDPWPIVQRNDVDHVLAAETTDTADDARNVRRRVGVWFVADGASGSPKVFRSVKRYTFEGDQAFRQTFETDVSGYFSGSLSAAGFAITSTGFNGNNEGLFADHARVVRPTAYAYGREEAGARDGDFTRVEGGANSALFPSTSRVEVTPWSRF